MCVCMFVCVAVCVYVCMFVCMYVCLYVCMYTYVCMFVRMYVCIRMSLYRWWSPIGTRDIISAQKRLRRINVAMVRSSSFRNYHAYLVFYISSSFHLHTFLGLRFRMFFSYWPPSFTIPMATYLPTYLPTNLPTYLPTYLPTARSVGPGLDAHAAAVLLWHRSHPRWREL